MLKLNLNGSWELAQKDYVERDIEAADIPVSGLIPATVPGDVHNDMLQNGLIEDPYYSDNSLRCGFITEKDSFFVKKFTVSKDMIKKHMRLEFKGIDTYSQVFFNGVCLGKTEDMFLKYTFDVSTLVREGENELVVCIRSIKNMAKKFPNSGYFGCFNVERIFMRKAQCHFSWDWAPNFPATGIWDDVTLYGFDRTFIADVNVRTFLCGDVSFFTTLDKETCDAYENVNKTACVTVSDGTKTYEKTFVLKDTKNNLTINVGDPKLWWPRDLGDPFLYDYRIDYYEENELCDTVTGKFGIREIEYREHPKKTENGFTSELYVNGKQVFLRGANWVPLDIMTGRISDDKYRHAIELAERANFSCLRVWGGGIYEKDIFYDICDEKGIMVWQDLAFACADIPDDYPGFNELVIPETEYQVTRLRNHPAIMLWTGGNEKTGTMGKNKTRGDCLVYYTLRGVCGHLDPTRPYFPSSPWSHSDIGNNQDSGDSHCSSFGPMPNSDDYDFRAELATFTVPMASEIAAQGCSSVKVMKSFIPEDKLWPTNEIWDLHLTRNPYDDTNTTFADKQQVVASKLYGKVEGFRDFVRKSMSAHAEFAKGDIEFHRTRKGNCSCAMLWMFSDVWPCGTWAVVDYDMTPKAAYYAASGANRPILPAIVQTLTGIRAYVVNDTAKSYKVAVKIGQMDVDGNVMFERRYDNIELGADTSIAVASFDGLITDAKNSFLFIKLYIDGEVLENTFFHNLWKDIAWPASKIETSVVYANKKTPAGYETVLNVGTDKYAKFVNIDFDKINTAFVSENYFDLLPGETKTISITTPEPVDMSTLVTYDWNNHQ